MAILSRVRGHSFLNCLNRVANLLALLFAQPREVFGQEFHAALSSLPQNCRPLLCGLKHYSATVLLVHGAANQALRFQSVNDAAHGGWTYLLSPGKLIQRHGAAKDQHRKGGKAGRGEAGSRILHADLTQQMNSSAVQAVRQFFDFVELCH